MHPALLHMPILFIGFSFSHIHRGDSMQLKVLSHAGGASGTPICFENAHATPPHPLFLSVLVSVFVLLVFS
jgi:hypothetical protein